MWRKYILAIFILAILFVAQVASARAVCDPKAVADVIEKGNAENREQIANAVRHITRIGDFNIYYVQNADVVVTGTNNEGLHYAGILNIYTGVKYNTLQVNKQEMLNRTISELLIPYAKITYPYLQGTNIGLLQLGALMEYENFSHPATEYGTNAAIIIIPMDVLQSYANDEITDQELINKSKIYINYLDGNGNQRRTVKL